MNLLGETLLGGTTPPVRLLFVYNANPLATLPRQERVRQGLQREDLYTVVFEQVMTDTALFADLLLPATTFLERRELSRGYGAQVLQDAQPAIAPVGESRSNHEVFAQLCRLLGLTRPGEPETDEEIAQAILAGHPEATRIRSELQTLGIAHPSQNRSPVPFIDTFPRTADGKVHLFPEELSRSSLRGLYEYEEDPASAQYPLALISPATGRTVSSTLGQAWRGQTRLEIHPDDAEARAILDGEPVRIFNDLGEVRVQARITREVRPGVVMLPKGLWSRHTLNGATANALCPDTLADLGGGACFNDARVQVERFAISSSS
jgi:anaerobic selenocysteine-containing dehydrogenase